MEKATGLPGKVSPESVGVTESEYPVYYYSGK